MSGFEWLSDPPIKFELFPETVSGLDGPLSSDKWRWRLKARNGRIIADGAEAYSSQQNCRRAVNRFIDLMVDWAGAEGLEIVVLPNG